MKKNDKSQASDRLYRTIKARQYFIVNNDYFYHIATVTYHRRQPVTIEVNIVAM
jgi:hypothetical protein